MKFVERRSAVTVALGLLVAQLLGCGGSDEKDEDGIVKEMTCNVVLNTANANLTLQEMLFASGDAWVHGTVADSSGTTSDSEFWPANYVAGGGSQSVGVGHGGANGVVNFSGDINTETASVGYSGSVYQMSCGVVN